MEFSCRVLHEEDRSIVVSLCGELDAANAPTLDAVLDGIDGPVVFDCSDLEFVDSSGLAIFFCFDRDGGASLRGVRPNVRRVLEITGLDGLVLEESTPLVH